MGVRIVLAEGEPIGLALKRFRKLLDRHRPSWKWYKPMGWRWVKPCFIKQTEIRRYKRFIKKFKAQLATRQAKLAGKQ